jgi:hypothetical protein
MLLPGCKGDIDPAQLENLRDDLDAVVSGTRGTPPREDTNRDGWDTEVFSARAQGTLKALALLLDSPPGKGPEAGLLADDFQCSTLRPAELEETFRDQHFIVRRGNKTKSPAQHKGRAGLERTFGELLAAFEGSSDRHSKLKLFEVETSGKDSARTRTYFQLSGRFSKGRFQVKATWRSAWKRDGEKWLLQELAAETYEETLSLGGEKPLFDDCTSSLLSTSSAFTSQLLPGLDHWMGRIELGMGIDIGGWQGLAVGDINGDGRDDLYVCQPGGLPNRLFVQNADGSVTERSAELGVDWLESTHGALFADLDNDGRLDLVSEAMDGDLAGSLVLYRNQTTSANPFSFRKVGTLKNSAGGDYAPDAWIVFDFDTDGDVDVVSWKDSSALLHENTYRDVGDLLAGGFDGGNDLLGSLSGDEPRGLLFEEVVPETADLNGVVAQRGDIIEASNLDGDPLGSADLVVGGAGEEDRGSLSS